MQTIKNSIGATYLRDAILGMELPENTRAGLLIAVGSSCPSGLSVNVPEFIAQARRWTSDGSSDGRHEIHIRSIISVIAAEIVLTQNGF